MAPIVLILGAGGNIGVVAARQFAEAGYQVATVSRSVAEPPSKTLEGYLSIRADLTNVDDVRKIFDKVQAIFGGVPSVIIYNAAHVSPCIENGNIFSVPLDRLDADMDLMIKAPYVAAGEAYRLWSNETTSGHKKLFIYTGNIFPKVILPVPDMTTMGIAKVGSCFWLGMADKLYKEKGFRFFFADQRSAEGGPNGPVPDAEAHAEEFLKMARNPDKYSFIVTFVRGEGVKQFEKESWL